MFLKICVKLRRTRRPIFVPLFKSLKKVKMSKVKIVLGTLAGIATGALLGVMFAPDSGATTRKKITKKGADYTGEVYTKFEDLVEKITDKMAGIKIEITDMVEKGSEKMSDAMADATTNGKSKTH
jgi:gas vesicle protein